MNGTALLTALVVMGVATAHPAVAGSRHSGTIVAVDPANHLLTLEEIGPAPTGRPAIARRSIALEPDATIVLLTRTAGRAPDGWVGGFGETPLTVTDVRRGDFVTLTLTGDRHHLTAHDIHIVRPAVR